MPTLDVAIHHAKAQAKRTGKTQFILRSDGESKEYFFAHKEALGEQPGIVGKVSATLVPIYTRLP